MLWEKNKVRETRGASRGLKMLNLEVRVAKVVTCEQTLDRGKE